MTETEALATINIDFFTAIEAAATEAKQKIEKLYIAEEPPKKTPTAVTELTFNTLKFEQQQGTKLGEYEIAHKAQNLPDKWNHAHTILRVNNATIANRYHGETYAFSYWLFGEDKIYRQKLKPKP